MKAALTPAERFTLTQAIASGRVSADQIEAHYEAGELPVVRLEPSTPSQPVPAPEWSVEIIQEPRRLAAKYPNLS